MKTTSLVLTFTTRIRRALLRHRLGRFRKRQRQMALPFMRDKARRGVPIVLEASDDGVDGHPQKPKE